VVTKVREQNLDGGGNIKVHEQGTVSVVSTDDPARHAFAFFENDSFGSPKDSHVVSFSVPSGKRLVIESVSINAGLDTGTGQKLVSTAVQAHVNGQLEDYIMAPTFTGTSTSGRDLYTVSQATRIYADGGTDVREHLGRACATLRAQPGGLVAAAQPRKRPRGYVSANVL
jgi:hypothetical protein